MAELSQRSLDAKVIMTDENYINFFPCMTIEKECFWIRTWWKTGKRSGCQQRACAKALHDRGHNRNRLVLGDKKYKL